MFQIRKQVSMVVRWSTSEVGQSNYKIAFLFETYLSGLTCRSRYLLHRAQIHWPRFIRNGASMSSPRVQGGVRLQGHQSAEGELLRAEGRSPGDLHSEAVGSSELHTAPGSLLRHINGLPRHGALLGNMKLSYSATSNKF